MFKNALEQDLKAIFKVRKVVFQRLESALEHGVLYCAVESVHEVVRRGQEAAQVTGRIGILGPAQGSSYGFFEKQLQKAPASLENRFWFGRTETPSEFTPGWELKLISVPFVYYYKAEYYPVKGKITAVKWFLKLIKGAK